VKFTIAQHEEMLSNQRRHWAREREVANRVVAAVDHGEKEMLKYEQQIAEAKRQGRDGFDSEKFLQRRK
jgi:hypothetical protein